MKATPLLLAFMCSFLLHNSVVWSQTTPQIIPPQGHGIFPHDFDIHPDSKTIATCGLDRKIVLWDIRTGIPFTSIIGHNAEIRSIRYSWEGEYIITASPDSTVKIWNSKNLKLIQSIHTGTQNLYAEFSRTTSKIVVATTDGKAKVYDLKGNLLTEIKAHVGTTNCAIFSTNESLLFTGGEDNFLRCFSIESKKRVLEWNLEAPVYQLFFDMFNTVLVVHTGNGRAELILIPEFKSYGAVAVATTNYFGSIQYVSNIDLSPDNKFFAYSDVNGHVFIADSKTKEARGFLSTHTKFISKVKYSFDMKYLVSLGQDNKMTIANLHNFDFDKSIQLPVRVVKQESDYPKNIYFDDNDKLYIKGFYTYDFDLKTGEIDNNASSSNSVSTSKFGLKKLKVSAALSFLIDPLRTVVLAEEGVVTKEPMAYFFDAKRTCFIVAHKGVVYSFDTKNERLMGQFNYDYEKQNAQKIIITPNQEIGILTPNLLSWYTTTGKKLWDFKYKGITDIDAADDGTKIAIGAFGNQLNILNNLGKTIYKHTVRDASIENVKFNHNGSQIALTGFEPSLIIVGTENGVTLWKTKYDAGSLAKIVFDKKDRLLAIIGGDRIAQIFDIQAKSNPQLFRLFPLKEDGILVCNKDNYYTATPSAIENLAFSYNEVIYTCDQFDMFYNRPDLVLLSSPYRDENYRDLLTSAFQKRVKVSTNPTAMANNNSAEVSIVNVGDFANYVNEKDVTLVIEAKDSVNALKSYQIWLNGVPLFESEGKRINGKKYLENIKIELVTGNNTIKIAAINEVGMESLKATMRINYESSKKPNLYIACIGVSEFKDSRFDLKYAAKDANDFMSTMEKSNSFEKVNKKLLLNGAVTKATVKSLKAFFEQADRDDVVMLFVAGHGVLDKNFEYYFATSDVDFEKPAAAGVSYSELEFLLSNIKAVKKLLLMDTCHSGELDKDEVREDLADNSEIDPAVTFRSPGAKLAASKGAVRTSLLVKELFADIRQSTGTTVISSSSGLEFSMESDQWKNGLFTYCLLNGIQSKSADFNKNGSISVSELQQYIKTTVFEKSGGLQMPTFRTQNIEMDFQL